MPEIVYNIKGQIIDTKKDRAIEGLEVQAWDKDLLFDDILGKAITGENGRFTIEFKSSYYQELCFDRKPDIFFKVFKNKQLIKSTEDEVLWNVNKAQIDIAIQLVGYWPLHNAKIDTHAFNVKTFESGHLDEESKKFINQKLNDYLKAKILNFFHKGSKDLKKAIKRLHIDYTQAAEDDLYTFIRKTIEPQLRKNVELAKELDKWRVAPLGKTKVAVLLGLDLPLKSNAIFSEEILAVKVFELSKIAGLKDTDAEKIVNFKKDLSYANDQSWMQLADDGILPREKIYELRLTFEMSKLSSDNFALIDVLKNDHLPQLNDQKISSMRELVAFRQDDWLEVMRQNNIEPPDEGVSAEAYAENLVYNIEKSFPSDYIFYHLAVKDKTKDIKAVEQIEPLWANNEVIFTPSGIADLDWEGIEASKMQEIESALQRLKEVVNTYRQLGMAEILNNHDLSTEEKKTVAQRAIHQLAIFYQNNPELDIRYADFIDNLAYTPGGLKDPTQILWDHIMPDDRAKVRRQLMAYQRLERISNNFNTLSALASHGFDSTLSVVGITEEKFVEYSGLFPEDARTVYAQAQHVALLVAQGLQTTQDAVWGGFGDIAVGNLDPSIANDLKKIDGYEDLFGSQNYCACDHCKSIFGPAAYFVDLMYFIEKNVLNVTFETRPDHPLYLKNRRPDLWNLKLTCENTYSLLTYLDIINEILENYLIKAEGCQDIDEVYDLLSQAVFSFKQPFNLSLTEIRKYLAHFELQLGDVCETLKEDKQSIAREKLNISKEEYELISIADTANVKVFYGNPPDVSEMDVQVFLRYIGIARAELDTLIEFKFVNSGLNIGKLAIVREQDPNDIQNFSEKIINLTLSRLDRIHRFIRLWRKLAWTLTEFNLVISSLGNRINDADGTIENIAALFFIQNKLNVSVEELCALWSDIPDKPVNDAKQSLFEILFAGIEPVMFYHASFDRNHLNKPRIDANLPLLLAGLGVSEADFLRLGVFLKNDLGINDDGEFELTRDNLSILYRHAKIAKALGIPVEDNLRLIRMALTSTDPTIAGIENILQVIEFADWIKTTPLEISWLWQLLNRQRDVTDLIEKIHVDNAMYFGDAFLSGVEGILEDDSKNIIAELETNGFIAPVENSSLFKLTAQYRIDMNLDDILGSLDISESARQKGVEILHILNSKHPRSILPDYLTAYLNIGYRMLHLVMQLYDVDLDDSNWITGLAYPIDESSPDKIAVLTTLVQQLEQIKMLADKLDLGESSLDFITSQAQIFKIQSEILDSVNVRLIVDYRKLLLFQENSASDIHRILTGYSPILDFTDEAVASMANILEVDLTLLKSVISSLKTNEERLTKNPIEAVFCIIGCLKVCQTLGVNASLLAQLTATDFSGLLKARETVYGAFRAKYEDQETCNSVMRPFRNAIDALKRDALSDYILSKSGFYKFENKADLYHYFLIDTEMEGCAKVSKIKAATLSLQLYVHRCLVNLEQSESDPQVRVLPSQIDPVQWEWRKNYRVWEANRKVFVYAENWIEPELRDTKTPFFEALEEDLLQQEISLKAAENAYKTYMTNFMQVANLKIAGNYYAASTKTLYLLGRTTDDLPQYYYRKCRLTDEGENEIESAVEWTPWEKIDLTINAEKVSPIVLQNKLYLFWIEILTKQANKIVGGSSQFMGYGHKISLKYSYLDMKGKWKIPVSIHFRNIEDPLADEGETIDVMPYPNLPEYVIAIPLPSAYQPRHDDWTGHYHSEPLEEYTLKGYEWERIYPRIYDDILYFCYCSGNLKTDGNGYVIDYNDYANTIDIFEKAIEQKSAAVFPFESGVYYSLHSWELEPEPDDVFEGDYLLYNREASTYLFQHYYMATNLANYQYSGAMSYQNRLANCIGSTFEKPYISAVNEWLSRYIINISGEWLLLSRKITGHYPHWCCERLGTSTAAKIAKIIHCEGLESFLSIDTQIDNKEDEPPFAMLWGSYFLRNHNHIDFKRSSGIYYRELYFHIPFLIANHLNASQKFREAQKWYHYIFNPCASEDPALNKPADRNWQYVLFRDIELPRLKDILSDETAIQQYKENPFNPHAIARIRLSAYQKAIVMKYIDNLLDWGDFLFTQDTFESINEAVLLYSAAGDILGQRPVKLGECETAAEEQITYEAISAFIDDDSEFLITMENYVSTARAYNQFRANSDHAIGTSSEIENFLNENSWFVQATPVMHYHDMVQAREREKAFGLADKIHGAAYGFGIDFIKQSNLVFCVPPNEKLLAYWDRVEDRLFKIRNCMNIKGIRRQLPLFQPPIDPGMLDKAKAAGLSIEDIVAPLPEIPPYRFSFLIEKAKSFTATVQGFGSALLSALEKKDTEELVLMRSVHEQNILKMTREIKRNQINEAKEQVESLKAAKTNLENQINYYSANLDEGLTLREVTQQISKHTSTGFRLAESYVHIHAALSYLIPQLGSPFAMKYGGNELGDSFNEYAEWSRCMASIADSVSVSAGLEANFERRKQEWEFKLNLATLELAKVDKQIAAAEIRHEIALKDLEIHNKNMEQNTESYEFYKNKFTQLGLYNWMATSLTKLYRQAYSGAYAIAKMAEWAYQFERDTDDYFIDNDNWNTQRAGLLAGERLMLQLHQMDKTYIEKNRRNYEVDQSFSMAQIYPQALIQLRERGSCQFEIPEIYFDLVYPGQFKRIIKSVRLTIPCVTGPYTNVSCQLTLKESFVRKEPNIEINLVKVPFQNFTSIATSNANNDGGVFEINFRDERYLPFEGAGAVSCWELTMPKKFRQFDYSSINDVILHISYAAREDQGLRNQVENFSETLEETLRNLLKDKCLNRLFSLRHEFSHQFNCLLHSPLGESIEIKLADIHFPFFLKGRNIDVSKAVLILETPQDQSITDFSISINGISYGSAVFQREGGPNDEPFDCGGLWHTQLDSPFSGGAIGPHTVVIEDAGDLAPDAPPLSDPSVIDAKKLTDIYFYLAYTLN